MTPDLAKERQEAAEKAIDSLARYKFMMFGYWAAIWVHLNRMSTSRDKSPFAFLVKAARERQDELTPQLAEPVHLCKAGCGYPVPYASAICAECLCEEDGL